jgi:hypothetical protein
MSTKMTQKDWVAALKVFRSGVAPISLLSRSSMLRNAAPTTVSCLSIVCTIMSKRGIVRAISDTTRGRHLGTVVKLNYQIANSRRGVRWIDLMQCGCCLPSSMPAACLPAAEG